MDSDPSTTVTFVSSIFGVMGSGFVIVSFVIFRSSRCFFSRTVLYMSCFDFVAASCWFFPYLPGFSETGTLCLIQAAGLQVFQSCSSFAAFFVSVSMYFLVRQQTQMIPTNIEKFEIPFLIFNIVGSGVLATVIGVENKYGKAGAWCWISDPRDPYRVLHYAIEVTLLLLVTITYVSVQRMLRTILISRRSASLSVVRDRIKFYLLAFLLARLPAIANRVQNFVDPEDPIQALVMAQALLFPLQGFFNALVFGFHWQLVQQYADLLHSCCGCCPRGDGYTLVDQARDSDTR